MSYTILEKLTNGYNSEYLFIFSLITVVFGISIIVTKNPVVSVLNLIGLFVTIAIYLMLTGLVFIGLAYLLVYVGAVSILFLFILMLINVRTSELVTEGKNGILLAIIVVICFNFTFDTKVPHSTYLSDFLPKNLNLFSYIQQTVEFISSSVKNTVGFTFKGLEYIGSEAIKLVMETANVYSGLWEICLTNNNHITSIGNILYGEFFMFLILTAFVLLLAMVGTIITTVKSKINRDNYTLALSTLDSTILEGILDIVEQSGILEFDIKQYIPKVELEQVSSDSSSDSSIFADIMDDAYKAMHEADQYWLDLEAKESMFQLESLDVKNKLNYNEYILELINKGQFLHENPAIGKILPDFIQKHAQMTHNILVNMQTSLSPNSDSSLADIATWTDRYNNLINIITENFQSVSQHIDQFISLCKNSGLWNWQDYNYSSFNNFLMDFINSFRFANYTQYVNESLRDCGFSFDFKTCRLDLMDYISNINQHKISLFNQISELKDLYSKLVQAIPVGRFEFFDIEWLKPFDDIVGSRFIEICNRLYTGYNNGLNIIHWVYSPESFNLNVLSERNISVQFATNIANAFLDASSHLINETTEINISEGGIYQAFIVESEKAGDQSELWSVHNMTDNLFASLGI